MTERKTKTYLGRIMPMIAAGILAFSPPSRAGEDTEVLQFNDGSQTSEQYIKQLNEYAEAVNAASNLYQRINTEAIPYTEAIIKQLNSNTSNRVSTLNQLLDSSGKQLHALELYLNNSKQSDINSYHDATQTLDRIINIYKSVLETLSTTNTNSDSNSQKRYTGDKK